jgi:hypothetical protein
MRYVRLGKTDLEVAAIAFGTGRSVANGPRACTVQHQRATSVVRQKFVR